MVWSIEFVSSTYIQTSAGGRIPDDQNCASGDHIHYVVWIRRRTGTQKARIRAMSLVLQNTEWSPSTIYASEKAANGFPVVCSINWEHVLNNEPENVAHWIRFLHFRGNPNINNLLSTLSSQTLQYGQTRPTHWKTYLRTSVPSLLVDTFCASGKFSNDIGIFAVRTIAISP